MDFLAGILPVPVLVDGHCHLDQPRTIFGNLQKVRRGKILGAICWRVAERFEHPRRNQGRNVVRLAVQHPARLFRRQAEGQLTEQRQEPMLIVFHAKPVSARAKNRTHGMNRKDR